MRETGGKAGKAISCFTSSFYRQDMETDVTELKHKGNSCIEENKCTSLREKPSGQIFKLKKHPESANLRQTPHFPTYTQNGNVEHHQVQLL